MADAVSRAKIANSRARWRLLDTIAESDLDPMVFRVAYLIVARMAVRDKPYRCAYGTLAKRARCSVDTIRRAVQTLSEKGFLQVTKGGGHTSTTFSFDWSRWSGPGDDEDKGKTISDATDIPF
ncbi:helix-turn-helix domain-containing protein [Nitrospirillum bahiense]|uniref:Helix-turn-helix protein n=1 Tax=Nitrospirillum amazonense TaxID=28077 RepID=A0A560FC77_9PROT|nr:hypothetical protein [Nitrospirillum amazonense]TWB19217.1 hypothetical protein FBZ88_12272 [Nitrospirillum amazonense]